MEELELQRNSGSFADVQITDSGNGAGPVMAVGIPRSSDDTRNQNDGHAARENPNATFNNAKEKLKDVIEDEADESQSEKQRQ